MTDGSTEPARERPIHEHIREYQELVGSDIHFAFQTIIDATQLDVIGFEALVRGIHGDPAASVLSRIRMNQRFGFDQACRIRALEAAARNQIDLDLHLNCSDIKSGNVELVANVIQHMARRYQIDPQRIVLELANLDSLGTRSQIEHVRDVLAQAGLRTLADNFGRRNADLRPIAGFGPEQLKLDRQLIQAVHLNKDQQAIVLACQVLCQELGITIIAAGVESIEEFRWLQGAGIDRFQGFFFAHPGLNDDYL